MRWEASTAQALRMERAMSLCTVHSLFFISIYVVCGINWCMFCVKFLLNHSIKAREEREREITTRDVLLLSSCLPVCGFDSIQTHKFMFTFDVAYHHLSSSSLFLLRGGGDRLKMMMNIKKIIINLFISQTPFLVEFLTRKIKIEALIILLIFLLFICMEWL